MAYKRISPLPVVEGGTQNSTVAAYSVVCGGTTNTGALQVVSGVGSSTQVLTSNGAGMLPTWQNAGGGGGATTPWTPTIFLNGSDPGFTYVTQTGFYTQVGNQVNYYAFMALSSLNGAPGGQLVTVTGLPVNADTSQSYTGLSAISNDGVQLPEILVWNNGMSTIIYFMSSLLVNASGQPDTGDGGYTDGTMTDNTVFQLTGSYLSA